MHTLHHSRAQKAISWILLIGLFAVFITAGGASAVLAQDPGTPTVTPPVSTSQAFTTRTLLLSDGRSVEETIINGPPRPPKGFNIQRQAVELPAPDAAIGTNTLTVPAFDWSFGCSATSGSMIAAYYDRNGFPNLYTGPTNGGLMPLDSSPWPYWTDGTGSSYAQCPLTASHQGLDGRAARGSLDDYWVSYLSSTQDPYLTNGLTQHTWGDSIGDYMRTSQSGYDNVDGSTAFYNWAPGNATRLTCADMEAYDITRDGTYGRKLFYAAKGYTVTDCYNQKTDNNGGGFTFAMFKAEIDANHPVMLNLQGHTIVGVGYSDTNNTVYLHDTWDYLTHNMTWGGSYSGMPLLSVSIVNFTSGCTAPSTPSLSAPADGATFTDPTPDFDWSDSANASRYDFLLDNDANFSSPIVNDPNVIGSSYAATPTLSDGVYYWRVRGHNTSGNCNSYGNWSSTRSFRVKSVQTYTAPYIDSLEGGDGDWTPSGFWHLVTQGANPYAEARSPTLSWWYGQDATGSYDNGSANSGDLVSAPILLPDASFVLHFWYWYQTEDTSLYWDQKLVQISVDGGAFTDLYQVVGTPTSTWAHSPAISLAAYAGKTVRIRFHFDSVDSTGNSFRGWYIDDFSVSIPNDDIDFQLSVPALPYVTAQQIGGATQSWDDPTLPCAAGPKYNTVWYRYIPAADETILLSTQGSGYDTVLGVWTGARGALQSVGCNDDSGTITSQLQIAATAGVTYRIEIAGKFPSTGANLNLAIAPLPGSFDRSAPSNGATGVSTSPTLSWGSSANAAGYEYCYDTSDDNTCSGWTSAGASANATLNGLTAGATYYWQVRAANPAGTTYAGGSSNAFWSFTTGAKPGAFNMNAPGNGSTTISTGPILSWGRSSGAASYEYCYDTSNDGDCSGWISSGLATSVDLSGLSPNATYYWRVRAANSFGVTYAGGDSPSGFWFFSVPSEPIKVYLPAVIRR